MNRATDNSSGIDDKENVRKNQCVLKEVLGGNRWNLASRTLKGPGLVLFVIETRAIGRHPTDAIRMSSTTTRDVLSHILLCSSLSALLDLRLVAYLHEWGCVRRGSGVILA